MTSLRYVVTQKGGPCALIPVTRPTPGPHEVSVRLKAVALNPWDCRQMFDGALVESWPAAIGADGAGVVEARGENVTQFEVGDEVLGLFGHGDAAAAFQEIAVVPHFHLARKPRGLAYTEAAALPLSFLTAASAIHLGLGILLPFLCPGAAAAGNYQLGSILIAGGGSNVGAAAIQILRHILPATPLIVTCSALHHDHLRTLGTTTVLDRHSTSLVADIRSATPDGLGVCAILDSVGACASQGSLLEALNPDGPKLIAEVFTGPAAEYPPDVKRQVIFGRTLLDAPGGKMTFTALEQLLSGGEYRLPTLVEAIGTGFDSIAEGLSVLEKGVHGRKLVVSISWQ